MTRKDYKLIADVFSKFQEWHHGELKKADSGASALEWLYGSRLLDELQNSLMDALESDNPRFNSFEFRYAASTQAMRDQYPEVYSAK